MDILQAIGHTSMVRLRKVVPPGCASIFAKLEWESPTGSMKDRMAEAVITRAEQDGRLKPGSTVVEYNIDRSCVRCERLPAPHRHFGGIQ